MQEVLTYVQSYRRSTRGDGTRSVLVCVTLIDLFGVLTKQWGPTLRVQELVASLA